MTKVIFIKDYNYYLHNMHHKKGDIVEAFIRHGGYVINHIYFGMNSEVMSLADWREQQINNILYDDIEG